MEQYQTKDALEAGLAWVQQSPKDVGRLEMIVCRPAVDERRELETAELSTDKGLEGDSWLERGSSGTPDGSAHPDAQVAMMNTRAIQLIAQTRDRWSLAGDQLFIDFDLSVLEPGQKLRIGTAVLEITGLLHAGCDKFAERFGRDALRWVNSREGRQMHLRGIYARVIEPGTILVGDPVVLC